MTALQEPARLTSLSHGAGCACKIGAAELEGIRATMPVTGHPDLLIGLEQADDAAVYRLSDELTMVQSVDFFTPIVDEPFDFGRIAAANALSDIYAMGAAPVLALNIVAFPLENLGRDVLRAILRGGAEVAARAGIPVAGGHSIDDPEPKYGMSVTGLAHPADIISSAGAQPGDELFLTKPLGGGLATTAAKRGLAPKEIIDGAIDVMVTLNANAAVRAREAGVTAMTDVTGFGLLGHLHELCEASGVQAVVKADSVPAIDGVLDLADDPRCVAGGSRRNRAHAETFTEWGSGVAEQRRVLLTDAMTSGGLLVAAPGPATWRIGTPIGFVLDGEAGAISVN